ncbi:MAG: restriction endonuclease subunit S [Bacteroidetes bacterium]|nr:restriction endonuclease subunit S [Bacteroidota bacterium]
MKEGWEIKTLGEVLSIERGGSPRPIDKYITSSPDGINWIKISDATASDRYIFETKEKITKEGLHKTRMVHDGDFILSNSMSFGRPYIMRTSGCIHDGWLVLKQNGRKIFETDFLYYLLSSPVVFNQFDYLAAGSTVRNLNIALVSSVEVPIPPLPEQRRIVAILDQAFAAIAKAKANAEQNLKNAKELFESYLQGVFEKKGEGWEEKPLEELTDEKCTLSYGIVQPGEEMPNGLPIVRPTDLTKKYISNEGLKKIDPKLAEGYKRTTLIGDELLLCVRGSTGVVSIALKELEGGNVTRGIVPIRFNPKIINQEFGYYLLVSNYIQKQIKTKTYGAALMQINIGDLRKIQTPFPSLTTQQTIGRQLDALSAKTKKLEAIYQKKIHNLEELKKSVLQKAFSGELKTEKALIV